MNDDVIGLFPAAVYCDPLLPEYQGNPLIEALPPVFSEREALEHTLQLPKLNPEERQLPGHIRAHAICRLFNSFFQPLPIHIELEKKISVLIRQGYLGRNPRIGTLNKHLQNGYERILQADTKAESVDQANSTAKSLTLIGVSGCGKSTALTRILSTYPQVIFHSNYNITQLPYLKVDCPHDGTLKSFCMEFFRAVDDVLNTSYFQKFGTKRLNIELMLSHMSQISTLHAVGVLVIDEIQHLKQAKSGGIEKMLNFFVTLINTIGVPVVMVGTPLARGIFEKDLRSGRRSAGFGSLMWDRMERDDIWEAFVKRLWKYQWLTEHSSLTPEMEETLYDCSQGVMDIVVKLYALSQQRAIVTGAERLSPGLLKKVFEDEFIPVHPMLRALRSGRPEQIAEFGDLRMPNVIRDLLEFKQKANFQTNTPSKKIDTSTDLEKTLLEILVATGIEEDLALPLIREDLANVKKEPMTSRVSRLLDNFKAERTGPPKNTPMKRNKWGTLSGEDLRYIFAIKDDENFYSVARRHSVIFDVKELM